jgi:hypothetical protein
MYLSPIKTLSKFSLLGNGFITDAGVSAARGVAMLTSLATFSNNSINLRRMTPTTKLPSYVLGFVSILIAVAVMAVAIYFKSNFILTKVIYAAAPRGISVLSFVCMAFSTSLVLGRMVYENVWKNSPLKLLSQKNISMGTLLSFNTCSEI